MSVPKDTTHLPSDNVAVHVGPEITCGDVGVVYNTHNTSLVCCNCSKKARSNYFIKDQRSKI